MEKIRISSLAKELGVKSSLLIDKCHERGLTHITHHANTLVPEQAEMIRQLFQPSTKVTPAEEPKVKETVPPPIVEQKKEVKTVPQAGNVVKVVQPNKVVTVHRGSAPAQKQVVRVTPVKSYWKKKHPPSNISPKRREHLEEVAEVKKPIIKEKETKVIMESPITVKDLSSKLGIRANEIITKLLLEHNIRVTINQILKEDIVHLLGIEYGIEIEIRKREVVEEHNFIAEQVSTKVEDMVHRAPIVTFLGHVDHGKTSLLDSIRQTDVAAGEIGGITQHIGAYKVEMNGKHVVFLDTPGHEAFTAMRARGANITDVVVLVVAADDGVMPQTEEALNHAKAANVPIVVAVNKIDKPGANPMRVKQQLAGLDLIPEEWGGKTQFVETSAITKKGIDTLLERLLLESEILELKANPKNPARGVVLEAHLSEGRGVVASILIQDGTLHQGDIILCGKTFGRARLMTNERGIDLKEAGPAIPVSVSDFSEVPEAGDKFFVVNDIQKAREIAQERQKKERETSLMKFQHVTLDSLYSRIAEGKVKEIKVILKADYKGSVEVLKKALEGLSTPEIKVKILHCGVGGITESDVLLADASDAFVIGFYVTTEDKARILAEEKGVEVRLYKIIYDATNEIKAAMEGMLEPETKEVVLGQIEIRLVYNISKIGNVAGCYVKSGKITRNASVRLIRDSIIIYDGKLESLKIVKDDVREVRAGHECGIKIANYDDIKVGDIVEAYEVQKIARTLTG
ncbi:MAG: translation initiation factor IF-2 [Candidatus Jettenia sp.]|uniref:Translation initiation factor IF-2 n=1 Tax=Candidatus Jettenia caeni TaxID=247490 RepID=I3IQY4_9BACT|nr:translation initiation factor IF-2 [Candidatus Jettenia sp. AMX1]MBC6929588.1 translation initiation factor IF-2 [Candidatus Jettenia sp.]NUN21918.1 translation initiation factor IF-2 [Candidatus Jettenia caeni]KAA0247969.1 MAG: translation initiation factor IF-2 [Candidatus Jettenia sp. AMX1]MCE7879708.1 translation initiation factor IF-2 [Candidatus Jettenia sp. AMX1]MDL1939151.1 translation initiation factor IF-2 [Candidatus Jettenia sp. AMX1]